jgi:hypothetical protein
VSFLGPDQIAPLLAATVATLRAEVRGLAAEARWRPAPGEWSVNECVGHLFEADARGFAGRIEAILAADGPLLATWDPPAMAAERHDDEADPIALVEAFAARRSEGIALVRSLSAGDLGRVGIHPNVGPLRVDEILAEWVHHDRNHVRQALAVSQARVWPQMGATRRFSQLAD